MPARLKPVYQALGWFDKGFLLLLAAYLLMGWTAPASGYTVLLAVAVWILAVVELVRLLRFLIGRAIWRLRNRLVVAYLFIAVVPVVLVLVLVGLGSYAVLGQVTSYLVGSEFERRTAELLRPARALAGASPQGREETFRRIVPLLERRFPGLEAVIRDKKELRFPESSTVTPPPKGWPETSGVVMRNRLLFVWAYAVNEPVEVLLIAPLTRDLLSSLVPGLGDVMVLGLEGAASAKSPASRFKGAPASAGERKDRVPPPVNRFDVELAWAWPIGIALWESPPGTAEGFLMIRSRTSALLRIVFGQKLDWSRGISLVFVGVATLFLIVELISLIIGVRLTRTITGAVHELYVGTQKVREGDFSHRIAVRGNDQLAELALSFNGMTGDLERLIAVEKEQERMQSELAIAREVQNQLFPKSIPTLRTVELTGFCNPARTVSGDYYDFLALENCCVALAIGDVAGKGISAALLMAAIQSIMHTQLSAGMSMSASAGNGGSPRLVSTSQLVAVLNRQLYANTSPEKYATFYFGLYNENDSMLTYTNAGHLAPILVRDGAVQRLDPTGMVVGAFPFARYEERSVQLQGGDLLAAFTDGIVEPENEYGEMFGEERLADLLLKYRRRESKEIISHVMEAVHHWTGSPELQDDMTMLLVRRL